MLDEYNPADPDVPYRSLACAIIEQCRKDARRERSGLPVSRQANQSARWCLQHSPVIRDLCALLDLPHALIVERLCND